MDEDSFWALITECRERSGNDTELMSRVMFRRLRALTAGDVAAFARHWERARSSLYSWPVADAACLLLGTVEEEHLRFVQDWLASRGMQARLEEVSAKRRVAYVPVPTTLPLADLVFAELRRRNVVAA